jgi:hypothetical protein
VTRLRCSDGLDLVSYGSIWLVTLALTIPSLSLGLVEVMLVALELLDIGYGGNSSDQFSSSFASRRHIFECERVWNGDGGGIVNGLDINVDCAWM